MFRKIIEPGQIFSDQMYRNERGDSVKTVVVLSIEDGGARRDQHPQLKYAKCRVDYATGRMGLTYVALHRLMQNRFYRMLKK